jgi:hypothetical protein
MKKEENSERVDPVIFTVRGRRVLLDADLARLYGVTTKALNQAVKRNPGRFPTDFAFRLNPAEASNLRSQIVTSKLQTTESSSESKNWSQTVTGSQKHRSRRLLPWVFSEHGALMAASVLSGPQAIHMSIFVVRAFVRQREQLAANSAILKRLAEIDRTLLQHNAALRDVYQKLLPLLQPPADPPKRRIGFHRSEE